MDLQLTKSGEDGIYEDVRDKIGFWKHYQEKV